MDPLSRAVDELGLRRTSFRHFVLGARPWALGYAAGVQGLHVVVSGACELVAGSQRERLEAGDVVILPRGGAHQLRSIGHRGPALQAAALVEAHEVTGPIAVGSRPTSCEVLCASLEFEAADHPMLASVDAVLVLKRTQGRQPKRRDALIGSLVQEVDEAAPGSEAMTTRLTELLFIETMRAFADSSPECPSRGWFAGLHDPQLSRALSAFHGDVAAPWSVESLARAAAQSRAVFAKRFAATLGEAPLAYVRRWRLFHARRLLRTTTDSVEEIAVRVGYGSAAALTLAFGREVGLSPGAYRAAQPARMPAAERLAR